MKVFIPSILSMYVCIYKIAFGIFPRPMRIFFFYLRCAFIDLVVYLSFLLSFFPPFLSFLPFHFPLVSLPPSLPFLLSSFIHTYLLRKNIYQDFTFYSCSSAQTRCNNEKNETSHEAPFN